VVHRLGPGSFIAQREKTLLTLKPRQGRRPRAGKRNEKINRQHPLLGCRKQHLPISVADCPEKHEQRESGEKRGNLGRFFATTGFVSAWPSGWIYRHLATLSSWAAIIGGLILEFFLKSPGARPWPGKIMGGYLA